MNTPSQPSSWLGNFFTLLFGPKMLVMIRVAMWLWRSKTEEDSPTAWILLFRMAVLLRSVDVLHDFYVPQFRAKMDLVPGMVTYFWLTPIRAGTFDVLCAELCGVAHYAMNSKVVVESGDDYEAWLAEQSTFAELMAAAKSEAGDEQLVLNETAAPSKTGAVQ